MRTGWKKRRNKIRHLMSIVSRSLLNYFAKAYFPALQRKIWCIPRQSKACDTVAVSHFCFASAECPLRLRWRAFETQKENSTIDPGGSGTNRRAKTCPTAPVLLVCSSLARNPRARHIAQRDGECERKERALSFS